ncbi:MAG: DUF58 domain-containing protein [Actinobacteria bacterium]|nr:DUF58 domain-containing protein [Actinomycetota bacterium]
MPTARGWVVLACGIGLYVAARGLGAPVLGVVALAFMLGPVAAVICCLRHRAADLALALRLSPVRPVEGRPWSCRVAVRGGLPRHARLVVDILGRTHAVDLRRREGEARGDLAGIAGRRGRYPLGAARVRVVDPLGLAAVERPAAVRGDAIVWLDAARAEADGSGGTDGDGRRHGVRVRAVGFDLRGIREHQPGESLRRVDWKTSARTGELMVRELEDSGRVEVLVVADPGGAGDGADPDRVDAALRRAAALAQSLSRAEAGAVLAVEAERRERVALDGTATARALALDALSGAAADRAEDLGTRLARCPDARVARTVIVVTATPTDGLAAWAERAGRRCPVEIVVVGPGPDTDGRVEPAEAAIPA